MSLRTIFFLDDLEVDEPIGWDTLAIDITRDKVLHGIGFEASVSDLQFYGKAAEYINNIKDEQGLKANIIFLAEQDCDGSGNYETVLQGRLDMNQWEENCGDICNVSAPIQAASCETIFNNKIEQSVDVDKTISQNGTTTISAYEQMGVTITIPTKVLDYKSIGHVDPAGDTEVVVFSEAGGGHEAYVLVRPEYVEDDTNIKSTHLTGSNNIGYSGPNGIFEPLSPQVLFEEDNANCFQQNFLVTGRLKGTITMVGADPIPMWGVLLEGELSALWPINDPAQYNQQNYFGEYHNPVDQPFDWTIDPYNWKPKNNGADGIYLYIAMLQLAGANFNGKIVFDPESFISITTVKACPQTPAQVYMVHELLSRVVENVTDGCMRVKSSYYGRTDSQPFSFDEDGCGGLRFLTSGLKLRQAMSAAFFIDPKTLIHGLQCIDNIGCGVEDDPEVPGNSLLRVEDLDFFYQDIEIMKCLGVQQAKSQIDDAANSSIIDIGYKKWETQANFGLDEFNSNREYHLAIQTLNNTIDLTSDLIAGQYAIEITREQQFADSSSADTTYDDEAFIMCLTRYSYNTFRVEQGNIVDPANMFNPNSIFNYRISPIRNLMRWYRSLINAYPNIVDSINRLYFSKGTGNYIASGQLSEGYGYGSAFCKLEGVDMPENADLSSTAFNDVAKKIPLWKNETITFDYPMSLLDYNNIKKNRYGYISYSCGNGDVKRGWINSIAYTPNAGKATLILRKQWGQ